MDEDEWERDQAGRIARQAFEYEVESYGIGDGQYRRPADPLYVHWPAYLVGYRTGLTLDAHLDLEHVR